MSDGYALWIDVDPATSLPEYPAAAYRLRDALSLMPGVHPLSVQTGRRVGPQGFALSVLSDGSGFTVQAGIATANHSLFSAGPYIIVNPTTVQKAFSTYSAAKPGAGLKRRDLIVAEVLDETVTFKPTTLREMQVNLIKGADTSGTPTPPGLPELAHEVGQIEWDGTNDPVVYPTLPQYTWAAGGVGVVHSAAEFDGLPGRYDGLICYDDSTQAWYGQRDGQRVTVAGDDSGYVDPGTPIDHFNNVSVRLRKVGNQVTLNGEIQRGGTFTLLGNNAEVPLWDIAAEFLPSGPDGVQAQVGIGVNSFTANVHLRCFMAPNGRIMLANYGNTDLPINRRIMLFATWFTD